MGTLSTISLKHNGTNYKSLLDLVYPVGSIYITWKDTSPASLFGGTWGEVSAGYYIMAAGTTYTRWGTGGANNITLTTAQIPAHNHTTNNAGAHSHTANSAGNHWHTMGQGPYTSNSWNWGYIYCTNKEVKGFGLVNLDQGFKDRVIVEGEYPPSSGEVVITKTTGAHTHSTTENGSHSHTVNNTGGGGHIPICLFMLPYAFGEGLLSNRGGY